MKKYDEKVLTKRNADERARSVDAVYLEAAVLTLLLFTAGLLLLLPCCTLISAFILYEIVLIQTPLEHWPCGERET